MGSDQLLDCDAKSPSRTLLLLFCKALKKIKDVVRFEVLSQMVQ